MRLHWFPARVVSLVFSVTNVAGAQSADKTPVWHHPCDPTTLVKVNASASTDSTTIAPDFLSFVGDNLQLIGFAKRIKVRPEGQACVVIEEAIPFQWTLSYVPPSGIPEPADASLVGSNTLQPHFITKRGVYLATLESKTGFSFEQASAQIRIDVVRDHGWVSIGPDGLHTFSGVFPHPSVGRINAIAIDPLNPDIIFAGTGNGGLWRSPDKGATWWAVSDEKSFPPSLSIGALAFDGQQRLFAGTGDPNKTGLGSDSSDGLYRSDDSGKTWTHVLENQTCSVPDFPPDGITIRRIIVDQVKVVYVAARAVYRSVDGGICWSIVLGEDHAHPISDMVLRVDSSGQRHLYVARTGQDDIGKDVIESRDPQSDSPTWSDTALPPSPVIKPSLPGRILLAASGPFLYALVSVSVGPPVDGRAPSETRFYRSIGGGPWEERSAPTDKKNNPWCNWYCGYVLALTVNPSNPNDVFVGVITVLRTLDGGGSWAQFDPIGTLGADEHTIVFDPADASRVYVGGDQAFATVRLDVHGNAIGGWTWSNRGMFTNLFFGLALSPAPGGTSMAAGGLQDNATMLRTAGRNWKIVNGAGGDGKLAAFDGFDPNLLYFSEHPVLDPGVILRSSDAREVAGTANVIWSTSNSKGNLVASENGGKLYYGSNLDGSTPSRWTCIDPKPADPSELWTGVAVIPGRPGMFVGTSKGNVYNIDVSQSQLENIDCSEGSDGISTLLWTAKPMASKVEKIAINPFAPLSSFYVILPVEGPFRIVRVDRHGNPQIGEPVTWDAIGIAGIQSQDGSFPSALNSSGVTTTDLLADPRENGTLYVATTLGMFVGVQQSSTSWTWTKEPDVASFVTALGTTQLEANKNGIVRLGTYGRSVYELVRRPRLSENATRFAIRRVAICNPDPIPWAVSSATLEVEYAFYPRSKAFGTLETAVIDDYGRVLRSIYASDVRLSPGSGKVLVALLTDPGQKVPLIRTYKIRVRMISETRLIASSSWKVPLSWKPSNYDSLLIQAAIRTDEMIPLAVSIPLVVNEQRFDPSLAHSVTVEHHRRVVVKVPETVLTRDGLATFDRWVGVAGANGERTELVLFPPGNLELRPLYHLKEAQNDADHSLKE